MYIAQLGRVQRTVTKIRDLENMSYGTRFDELQEEKKN